MCYVYTYACMYYQECIGKVSNTSINSGLSLACLSYNIMVVYNTGINVNVDFLWIV